MNNPEKEILEIKTMLVNLERAFLMSQQNGVNITQNSDKVAVLEPEVTNLKEEVSINTSDIITTQEGLAETYEETNTSITQLEEALVEVYEIIVPKE